MDWEANWDEAIKRHRLDVAIKPKQPTARTERDLEIEYCLNTLDMMEYCMNRVKRQLKRIAASAAAEAENSGSTIGG